MKNFENNNASLPLDTPEGPEYDSESELSSSCPLYSQSSSGLTRGTTPSLSSSCLTRGSIKQQCQMDTPKGPEYDNKGPEYDRKGMVYDRKGTVYDRGEYGRSMVEMLGVLAIIGVLSIGAISGYSYAMNKHMANRTINDIYVRLIDIKAQYDTNGTATLDGWKSEKTSYPMEVTWETETEQPLIKVSDVHQPVCELIVKGWQNRTTIAVNNYFVENDDEEYGCMEEKNELLIFFEEYDACGNTFCTSDHPLCKEDTQKCVACLANTDCLSEKPVCNGQNECEVCPAEKPYYDEGAGRCVECQGDEECEGNALCLDNVCTSFTYTEIDPTLVPGADGWVYLSESADYFVTKRKCIKLGKTLSHPMDYTDSYTLGKDSNAFRNNFANTLYEQYKNTYFWCLSDQEDEGNGRIINMNVSDGKLHYYHADSNSKTLKAYCH